LYKCIINLKRSSACLQAICNGDKNMHTDEKDFEILSELEKDSSQPLRKLARKTGIPMATVHHRIRAMKKQGVILNYTVKVDNRKVGKSIHAFTLIEAQAGLKNRGLMNIGKAISRIAEVEGVYVTTGIYDIIAEVRAKDMDHLSDVVLKKIREIDGVSKISTMLTLVDI